MTDTASVALLILVGVMIVADVVARFSYRHCRHRCCQTYCDCDGHEHRLCCRCKREVSK